MNRVSYSIFVILLAVVAISSLSLSQTNYDIVASYDHQASDTLRWYNPTDEDSYPLHVRDVFAGIDADNDGKMEIVATDYNQGGRVHVFEQAGTDMLELVWSSPANMVPDTVNTDSSPRDVLVTDLDADGQQEITFIIHSNPMTDFGGVYVFEWDGVTDNGYGDTPSTFFNIDLSLSRLRSDNILAYDADQDGRQELFVANNGPSAEDLFFILAVDGNINPGGGGFEAWREEFRINPRDDSNMYGGGSAYSVAVADLDGDGTMEIVFSSWNDTNIFIAQAIAADTYVLNEDTSATAGRFLHVTPGNDAVTIKSLATADFDDDGNDEVYLTPWSTPASGNVYVVNYSPGDNVLALDTNHVRLIASRVVDGDAHSISTARHGQDLGNIFVVGSAGRDLALTRYLGGPIDDPLSYSTEFAYVSDPAVDFTGLTVRDSVGVIDTVFNLGSIPAPSGDPSTPFPIGLASGATVDFDNDQKLEAVLGYQSTLNWMSIVSQTYDTTAQAFQSVDTTFVDNPNARIVRVIEGDVVTGFEVRDLTFITPEDYRLEQNYPNPFNPSTTIAFRLPIDKKISVKIFDVLGKHVRTLINDEEYAAGSHQVVWHGRNDQGQVVGSGTYFYRLEFGNFSKTRKMLFLK